MKDLFTTGLILGLIMGIFAGAMIAAPPGCIP